MRRAIGAGKRREEVIEGAVLLNHDHDVANVPLQARATGRLERRRRRKRRGVAGAGRREERECRDGDSAHAALRSTRRSEIAPVVVVSRMLALPEPIVPPPEAPITLSRRWVRPGTSRPEVADGAAGDDRGVAAGSEPERDGPGRRSQVDRAVAGHSARIDGDLAGLRLTSTSPRTPATSTAPATLRISSEAPAGTEIR